MKKIVKLRICDWSLLVMTPAVLVSGIQLEATHSSGFASVWLHIVVGLVFMGLIAWHIYLHFGASNWFVRFHKQKSQLTRILWWLTLIVLLSGVVATLHWIASPVHSAVGGVHGKLGFLMVALAIAHIAKRIKFFQKH